jgi:2,3-bisphosphoglycerate-independent phosphoglycerate mutase
MAQSETVLRGHQVNVARLSRGDVPVTAIWLFWGSREAPEMPAFKRVYGVSAAMTSGVDLLRGLAKMAGMDVLNTEGVTDGLDNDYAAQAIGALGALGRYDMAVVHIEAPDEAAHEGSVDNKIEAIQRVDREVVSRLRSWRGDNLRVLVMPDHPTPIITQTHSADPVPFLLWGSGFKSSEAERFTEAEAGRAGLLIDEGYKIMGRLVG